MTHTPWKNDHGLVTRVNKDGFRSFDIFDVREWQGEHDEGLEIAETMVTAVNSHDGLLEVLETIAKGEGAFSRDPLTHAGNCIDEMKSIAQAAIKAARGAK